MWVYAGPMAVPTKNWAGNQRCLPTQVHEPRFTDEVAGVVRMAVAAGERVKTFDSLDEVASGNAQMYHGADYYWKGKHPGWAYYSAVPFGLTNTEFNAWYHFGGGEALHDELAGEFGVKGLLCGNTGVQMGGWFRKEINSADDFKGLKMRMPGLGGDVLAKLGAGGVVEVYEAPLTDTETKGLREAAVAVKGKAAPAAQRKMPAKDMKTAPTKTRMGAVT